MNSLLRISFLLLAMLLATTVRADVSRALLEIHERLYLEEDGSGVLPAARVQQPDFVARFYELAEFQPMWTESGYAQEMLELLRSSELEGLNPADYHLDTLLELKHQYDQPWSDKGFLRAQVEVLLTDGILLYARHLIEGKVDPRTLDASWNYSRRDFDADQVAQSLLQAIAQRRVTEALEALKPDVEFYGLMKDALLQYRQQAGKEVFAPVPEDELLRRGDTHANVISLRHRLHQMGYLQVSEPNRQFDAGLESAVLAMQRDHGLEADGIVGRDSFSVLNLSAEARVERLRINLDRLRWMAQDISEDFVVVNIAGFELYYVRDGIMQWETPVMVGSINTRTPVFQARLKYLEFNPTWNVPRSILGRSLLPKFKANPQYAVDKGYRFLDSKGNPADPLKIDFKRYSGANFPYRVVQMPGPDNAMGRVKFMFPNRHAVYLHDTPSRELFSRSERAFSSGCIRVKNPLTLAEVLLDDPAKWSGAQVSALVDSGQPRQVVQMPRRVDVMLMYWTVSPAAGGGIQFHRDIYDLDPAALQALNATP